MTILCEPDQQVAGVLACFIEGEVHTVANPAVAARVLDTDPRHCLVVLGPGLNLPEALLFATHVQLTLPTAGVILLNDSPDPQLRLSAADAGVHEVVPTGDGSALTEACRRTRA